MLRDLRCKCALALNLLFASLSLGQVTDGSASWWDPPSQYIGACNVPVNAWGPNFIATAIQNWQRGGSGVCGQQIQITSKVNGARLIGYVTDLCLVNCTETTSIQLSLSFWKQLYNGSLSPASQLTIPIKFELVGTPQFPPPSQVKTGAPGLSTNPTSLSTSSTPIHSLSSAHNAAAASKSLSKPPTSSQTSTSNPMRVPTGAIVGAAVGGVALAIILSLVVLFCVRRKRREQRRSSVELRPSTDRNRSDSSHLPMVTNAYPNLTAEPETRISTLTHSSSQNRLSSHRKPVPLYDPELMSEFPTRNSSMIIPDSAHPSWRNDPYLNTFPRPRSPYRSGA